ncbi:hypothetical protein ACJMK2_010496 [Sinanodonta woodiana]|uniref:Uncharacterized protein n=1 Tax=Sinanodonta woodiana TaxID=1069815 RepID=A0ABD3VFJ9_SINWO
MWDFFKTRSQRRSRHTSQSHNSRRYDQHNLFVPSFQHQFRFYGSSGLYLPVSMNYRYQFSETASMFHPHIPKCLGRISCSDLLMGNRVEDYFASVSSGSQNEDSTHSPLIEGQNGSDVDTVSEASVNSLINLEAEDISITDGYIPVIEAPPNGFPGELPPSYEEAMGRAERWSDGSSWCLSDSDIDYVC